MINVLLLDDDELFRKMVIPGLASKGMEILEASSGKEALELLSANKFDLLIVDGMLPDTEGIKLSYINPHGELMGRAMQEVAVAEGIAHADMASGVAVITCAASEMTLMFRSLGII